MDYYNESSDIVLPAEGQHEANIFPTVTFMGDVSIDTSEAVEIIEGSFALVSDKLKEFAASSTFEADMLTVFGESADVEFGKTIIDALPVGGELSGITVVPADLMNGANGGFDSLTGVVYLADALVEQPANLADVITEELGHYIDLEVKDEDTTGDEGEYFAALVRGDELSPEDIGRLRGEDDTIEILNGLVEVEASSKLVAGTGSGGVYEFSLVEWSTAPVAEELLGESTFFTGLDLDPTTGLLYGAGSSLYLVDATDGSYQEIGPIRSATEDYILPTIAFSPSGVLYASDYDSDSDFYRLYTVNTDTAFATEVGIIPENGWAIDFAPNGTLYGATFDLITIDPSSGNILSNLGTLEGYPFILELDITSDGTIYGVDDDFDTGGSFLYEINPFLASTTIVGSYPSSADSIASISGATLVPDPEPTISIDNNTIVEGNKGRKNAKFTVTLDEASDETVKVNYATANGSAKAGEDYRKTSGTLTFKPGQTQKTVTVPVFGDTLDEKNEKFKLNLSKPRNAELGDKRGIATIRDNDKPPALSIGNERILEGNRGRKNAKFTVTLDEASEKTVKVNYATADGTAKSGQDYRKTTGNLTFKPGQTKKTITVPVFGDNRDESNEKFTVTLRKPKNAKLGDKRGFGTIRDND